MKYPNRTQLNVFLLPLTIMALLISLVFKAGEWYDYALRGVALLLLIILLIVNYIWNVLYFFVLRHKNRPKPACPYFTAEQCPHADKRECQYDTSVCHFSITKPKKGRVMFLTMLSMVCVMISVAAELVMENDEIISIFTRNYDVKTWLKVLQPLTNSIIAAVVVYFLIDIPGRLREYQDFFVDLLSSDKNLKLMKENRLTELRKNVTWHLHVKDFPNMPKGLIDIDENFCEMLKRPYFKTYSQSTTVSSLPGENTNMLQKKVSVNYTAYNPHSADKPIRFDIGLANSLSFQQSEVEEAKTLFQLKSFFISFDGDEREYNLLPHLRIGVSKENKDGFLYNGRILLMPNGSTFNNAKNPLEKEKIEDLQRDNQEELSYTMIGDSSEVGLFVTFKDKIRVRFEYEVRVPKDDISYTKRLRYPVKYFTLNYSLDESMTDMKVVGQIIGTLINQSDISAEISHDKKRIILKTQNWLLPQNGAMVVHCNA